MNWKLLGTMVTLIGVGASVALGQGTTPTIVQGDYISNVFGNSNFIKNPNAKLNTKDVTFTGSQVVRSATTPLVATSEFNLSLLQNANADWSTRAFDAGMKGQNCEARFTYRGFATATTTAQIIQNSLVVAQLVLTPSTDPRIASINFPCGDLSFGTTFRIAQTTAAMTGTNEIGGIYVGLATNMANVAQAENVVIAYANGSTQSIANATATKLAYQFESLDVYNEYDTSTYLYTAKRAGNYLVSATMLFSADSFAANTEIEMYVQKNGNSVCANTRRVEATITAYQAANIVCTVPMAAGDTLNTAIYQNAGGARSTYQSQNNVRFQITRFPSSSELVVKPETQNVFAGLKAFNSPGIKTNDVISASWTKLTSGATLTRTTFGKADTTATNDLSITVNNLPVGTFQITATAPFHAQANSAADETACAFGLADSATGGPQIAALQVSATGDASVPTQYGLGSSMSGLYTNTAVGNKTFYIQAFRLGGAGKCFVFSAPDRPFTITVVPVDQPSNSALYVQGPVLGAQTGAAIPSGYQGEQILTTAGSNVTPGASIADCNKTVVSQTLQPGNYLVFGTLVVLPGSITGLNFVYACISTTPNATDSAAFNNVSGIETSSLVPSKYLVVGPRYLRVTSPTTIYLTGGIQYTTLGSAAYASNSSLQIVRLN